MFEVAVEVWNWVEVGIGNFRLKLNFEVEFNVWDWSDVEVLS